MNQRVTNEDAWEALEEQEQEERWKSDITMMCETCWAMAYSKWMATGESQYMWYAKFRATCQHRKEKQKGGVYHERNSN